MPLRSQIYPRLSTLFYQIEGDYVRALLKVVFPLARNYTGKKVDERETRVLVYMVFWLTLLSWKFYFSYQYEIKPCALPALELYDDFMNLDHQNLPKTIALIVSRWLPFAAIYCLDALIWYSMWAGLVGLWVGMEEKLGKIRDFADVRRHFMRMPENFWTK